MCYSQFFLTKLLTLGILFPMTVRSVVLAKSVILGILFLTSFMLVLRAVVVAKLVMLGIFLTSFFIALRVVLVAKLAIPGILSSIFFLLALYTSF